MPDQEGYPFVWELEKVEKWDIQKDGIEGLLDLIEAIWHWSEWGFIKESGFKKIRLQLHTGGWSGNESIIKSLQANMWFWMFYWQASERGGHYYFEIPKEKRKGR